MKFAGRTDKVDHPIGCVTNYQLVPRKLTNSLKTCSVFDGVQAALVAARVKAHPVSPGQQAADWVAYALAAAPSECMHLHSHSMSCHLVADHSLLAVRMSCCLAAFPSLLALQMDTTI